jgi:hypothetical protein
MAAWRLMVLAIVLSVLASMRPAAAVDEASYAEIGIASWYGAWHHGKRTANGELFDMAKLTAAHPSLPLDTVLRVTNPANGRSVVVTINDRGPYFDRRVIDLSARAAEELGMKQQGIARVKIEILGADPSRKASLEPRRYEWLFRAFVDHATASGGSAELQDPDRRDALFRDFVAYRDGQIPSVLGRDLDRDALFREFIAYREQQPGLQARDALREDLFVDFIDWMGRRGSAARGRASRR